MMKFLVLNEHGQLVSKETTPEGAREVARDYAGSSGQVVDETAGATSATIGGARENPVNMVHRTVGAGGRPESWRETMDADPKLILAREDELAARHPHAHVKVRGPQALATTGIQPVSLEEVQRLTNRFKDMRKVFDRLQPFLQGTAAGGSLARFQNWQSLLKTNYKMARGSDRHMKELVRDLGPNERQARPGKVVGLSLLPYWSGASFANALRRAYPGTHPSTHLGENAPKAVPDPDEFPKWNRKVLNKIARRMQYMEEVARDPSKIKKHPPGLDPEGVQEGLAVLRRAIATPHFFRTFSHQRKLIDAAGPASKWVPETVGAQWPADHTVCPGSTTACRCACLVLSGQQTTGLAPKIAFTMALHEDPVAFCAWLAWCCMKFFQNKEENTFVRLNVSSDLVWELIFPALFDLQKPGNNVTGRYPLERSSHRSPGASEYYDYSAISPLGRVLPENYDVTMSFKGTNWDECRDAMDAGFRSAVVLVQLETKKGWDPKTRLKGLPDRFMGYPVVDGDSDDMRAMDPGGSIAALRYKPPKMVADIYKQYQRYRSGFIVPVVEFYDDGVTHYVGVSTPRQSGGEDFMEAADDVAQRYRADHVKEFGTPGQPDAIDRVGEEYVSGDESEFDADELVDDDEVDDSDDSDEGEED